jgi:hypothetical protein
MIGLAPAEIALRVGIFAGILGVVGLFPPNLQWMGAFVLGIVALIYFYEIWAARASRRAQRDALIVALLAAAGGGVLIEGWMAWIATPLIALAVVCMALWFVGTLGSSSDDTESETLH